MKASAEVTKASVEVTSMEAFVKVLPWKLSWKLSWRLLTGSYFHESFRGSYEGFRVSTQSYFPGSFRGSFRESYFH